MSASPPTNPTAAAAAAARTDTNDGESATALSSAVRSTALMTLGSRVGGLIRDVLVGRIFGDTALNSAFQFAFAIPNMFRRLFGEGALSAAFIPEYTHADKSDPKEAARLASLTIVALAAVTAGITIIVEIALLATLLLLRHSDERRLMIELVMVMLPFMPLICIVAILAGMLQVHGRFAAAASGPLVLNGFIIGVAAWSLGAGGTGDRRVAYILGAATVMSAATQLWWFARLLRPHVRWARPSAEARTRGRAMLRRFVPVAIGLGALQLSTFLDGLIATFPLWFETEGKGMSFPLDGQSNGILMNTARVYQFPLGVFGIAVATAAFPLLARHRDDKHLFTGTLRRGLRLSLAIGLPATIGLLLVRHDVMAVLYGYGPASWTRDGLGRAAAVLMGYSLGVWAYSVNHVLTRAFYARGDTRTPMSIAIGGVALSLALNLSLIWSLREAGMAWATSIGAIAQCAVLAGFARRKLCDGPVLDRESIAAIARIVAASVLMGAAVWGAQLLVPGRSSWTEQLVRLIVACGVGLVAYAALCRALGIEELRWLMRRGRSTKTGVDGGASQPDEPNA